VDVTHNDKDSILTCNGISYCRKTFYSTGPWW